MRLEATGMWLCKTIPRIPWLQYVGNEEVLRKIGTALALEIRKRLEISSTHKDRGLWETETYRSHCRKEGQRETSTNPRDELCKWIPEQGAGVG